MAYREFSTSDVEIVQFNENENNSFKIGFNKYSGLDFPSLGGFEIEIREHQNVFA
jgi:hypothetical protein